MDPDKILSLMYIIIIIGVCFLAYRVWKGGIGGLFGGVFGKVGGAVKGIGEKILGKNICDTRRDKSQKDSCMNCKNGYRWNGINDTCCKKGEKCNKMSPGDSVPGKICDIRISSGKTDSCSDCLYGYRKKGLNDWCCQLHEKNNCNSIKRNKDGTKIIRNIGGQMCDTRKKSVDPDSCLNCKFGYIKKGVNDWCCQEKEKGNCTQLKTNADGTQSYDNKGGSMCDTTKKSEKSDSCLNCKYGYKRPSGNLNDFCCQEKEKGTCTTMTVGKDGKITFDNKGGSMCDTRKKQKDAYSCLNCKHGYIRKGLNDWCCQKKESGTCIKIIKNKDGSLSYANKGGNMCDTRKKPDKPDSCLNCKNGYIRKGLNDWCCQKKEKKNCIQLKKNKDGSVSYANKGGSMCDTRKKAHEADSCKNCLYGRIRKGANDWCCQKKENCKTDNPHYKKQDGGYICDTRKPASKNDSCLNCKHGYVKVGLNDWCCEKKEKKNCKQIKNGKYTNDGGSKCDTRKKAYEADSCKNCTYGRVRKGLNDWCCQKKENCKKDNPHYKKPEGGFMCDTRKPKSKNDSCLNCKHGYRRKGLNDWCCQKKEKKNCKQIKNGKYTNDGGNMCDTRKPAHEADSCKNCTYGRVRKGTNDWCCRKKENCMTDNPHFKYPSKNNGGSMCDTRKSKKYKDSCKLCKFGRIRKGANDWCCRKKENCMTANPYFKKPSKNNGGSMCDTRKSDKHKDSCKLCKYGRVRKGFNDWCCRKSENCKKANPYYQKPFWSKCYKDEQCRGNRDRCIKRDCKKKGLKYKGKWHDCGGWKFKGYCQ
jgi:hypothetical protein